MLDPNSFTTEMVMPVKKEKVGSGCGCRGGGGCGVESESHSGQVTIKREKVGGGGCCSRWFFRSCFGCGRKRAEKDQETPASVFVFDDDEAAIREREQEEALRDLSECIQERAMVGEGDCFGRGGETSDQSVQARLERAAARAAARAARAEARQSLAREAKAKAPSKSGSRPVSRNGSVSLAGAEGDAAAGYRMSDANGAPSSSQASPLPQSLPPPTMTVVETEPVEPVEPVEEVWGWPDLGLSAKMGAESALWGDRSSSYAESSQQGANGDESYSLSGAESMFGFSGLFGGSNGMCPHLD